MNGFADAVEAVAFFGTIAITIKSIAGVWGKRLDAQRDRPHADAVEQRLARIENAVDAIAIEVERVGESQRFATRLAAQREAGRIAGPRATDGRTTTPH
ncbi:MAG TPA: hypothetical protein VHV78_06910 [Gemmatimonadaceae bacterium]|nr:hypothetical protein [Gemmatimonadaceae bacterium]